MTIHPFEKYQCKYCAAEFIPIPEAPNCPNCGLKAEQIFPHFMMDMVSSASFNIHKHKSAFPGAWAVCGIADWYYSMIFYFIVFVSEELKIEQTEVLHREYSEITAQSLTSRFLEPINFGETEHLRNHLEVILPIFLKTIKANDIRLEEEMQQVVDSARKACANARVVTSSGQIMFYPF